MSGYHRCGGCHHNKFHCPHTGSRRDHCIPHGPFIAIDKDCLFPPKSGGTIISYTSGLTPAVLASGLGGLIGTVSTVGRGTAVPGLTVANNTLTLPGLNTASTVPREGEITAISATFEITVALDIAGETATVSAEIYKAEEGSNVFTATGAKVDLSPPLTSLLAVGTILTGSSSNFDPVPVNAGDRLVLVFSLSGTTVVTTVSGAASAGITID